MEVYSATIVYDDDLATNVNDDIETRVPMDNQSD